MASRGGYDGGAIIEDIELRVGRVELVTVIGPNGSGKSTLLKGLTGRAKVLAGRVRLDGDDVTAMHGDRLCQRGLGFVHQTRHVFSTRNVEENLRMGGYLLSRKEVEVRMATVYELLPALEPIASRTAIRLSGGERKMLAMGRVLVPSPKFLLLDEPTEGLSPDLAHHLLYDQVPTRRGGRLDAAGGAKVARRLRRRAGDRICRGCPALALRAPLRVSRATAAVVYLFNGATGGPGPDRWLSPQLRVVADLVRDGAIRAAVDEHIVIH